MKFLKYLWSPLLALGLIYFFNKPLGAVPALGKFFSPFHGFLQNTTENEDTSESIFLKGVKDKVKIIYDENYVPHVFAQNEDDLYFAQGYLVAKDRLCKWNFTLMWHLVGLQRLWVIKLLSTTATTDDWVWPEQQKK